MADAAEKMNYETLLDAILHLSQQMLQAASEENWENVARLAVEREPLVGSMPAYSMDDVNVISARDKLENILEINQNLEALGRVEMNRCATEVRKVSNNKAGAKAYGAL